MNHNVNVCPQNERQLCYNHDKGHPGLKRLYSKRLKTKPVYYTNTRDCLESQTTWYRRSVLSFNE